MIQQTRLLICGSRYPTPAMINYATLATVRAYHNRWIIYCGDAIGIDAIDAYAICFDADNSHEVCLLQAIEAYN